MWIADATRAEIVNAAREVTRQAHDPSARHQQAVCPGWHHLVLEGARPKRDLAKVNESPASTLLPYADSSFAENGDEAFGIWVSSVACRGEPCILKRTQDCASLSSTKSGCMTLADVTYEESTSAVLHRKPQVESRSKC